MIKENRIVSTCGIMALIPDEDDSDVVVEYYNRVLNNYGGNLRAVCQNYPIVNIFYDEKLDSYYAVSEEVDDKDPLLKWNNLFHYKFWKNKEREVKLAADMIAANFMAQGQAPVLGVVLKMARQQVLMNMDRPQPQMKPMFTYSKLFAPPTRERVHYSQRNNEHHAPVMRYRNDRANRLFEAQQRNAAMRVNQMRQQQMYMNPYQQPQVLINRDGVYDDGFGNYGDANDTTDNFKVTTKFAAYPDMSEFGKEHEEQRFMNDQVGVTGLGNMSGLFKDREEQMNVDYHKINTAEFVTSPPEHYHPNPFRGRQQVQQYPNQYPQGHWFNPTARSMAFIPNQQQMFGNGNKKSENKKKPDLSEFIKKDGEGGEMVNFDDFMKSTLKTASVEKPNAFDMLARERFNKAFEARQKLFDIAKTDEEKDKAMNMTPRQAEEKLKEITGNKQPEQKQQVTRVGLGYGYQQPQQYSYGGYYGWGNDDDWMLPTKEELESGLVPYSYAVIDGKPSVDVDKLPKIKKERIKESDVDDISKLVCTSFLKEKEDGTSYREYYGEEEAVKAIKSAAALDYKEAAVLATRKQKQNEVYELAGELRRYNSELADNLIWMSNEDPMRFEMFKVQCISKLIKYRHEDPLAEAKSTVKVENNKLKVEAPKKFTMEELQKIADEESKKMKENSEQAKVEQKVKEIQQQAEGAIKQIEEVKNSKDISTLIFKLQAMTDIRVFTADEEEEFNQFMKQGLTPIQELNKSQYFIWKKFMERKKDQVPEGKTYDEWFDEWWYGPNHVVKDDERTRRKKWMESRAAQREDQLTRAVMMQPTEEQRRAAYDRSLYKAFRQFDGGKIPEHQTLYEFFNGEYGLGYMYNCHRQEQIRKQAASVVKYYDPNQYAQMIAQHRDARMDSNDGVKFKDLIKSDVYRNKRQKFIESLFKKNPRGMIL